MREIKFRAWDTTDKKMYYDGLFIGLDGDYSFNPDLMPKKYNPLGFEVMQYTGLKDKNGKEIYCSDLIKTPAGTGEVIWEGGCYRIYWNQRDNTTLHDTKPEQMEVLGNKYEGLQNSGKGDII